MFRLLAVSFVALYSAASAAQEKAQLAIRVVDQDSGGPIPCRIHLRSGDGTPVRSDPLPFFRDHFVCEGAVNLEVAPGKYSYEIERGPEYWSRAGNLTLEPNDRAMLEVKLERLADMSAEGWWPGDLHVHRPIEEIELLLKAEDLHVAPVITWWNNRNIWNERPQPERLLVQFDTDRLYHIMGGEDEREGGALMYFNMKAPLAITGAGREYPSPMRFLSDARKRDGVWVDIEKPFWWDVPIWLASGQADSIGLANNHMCRSQMYESEAWGKPRDSERLPPPRGNGFWTQEIYYQILNCGIRIPPSAGSASGVLPNPVGYNRVYVHLGEDLDYSKWWEGLRAGRSFVSNGPLLRCRANGKLPGYVFVSGGDSEIEVSLEASLSSRDPISAVEVVQNGSIVGSVSPEAMRKPGGLGTLRFRESGWFLVRAITNKANTFRFASTAPFYVEIGDAKRRISRSAVRFFLNWVKERRQRVRLDDANQKSEVIQYHEMAEAFWSDRMTRANAD